MHVVANALLSTLTYYPIHNPLFDDFTIVLNSRVVVFARLCIGLAIPLDQDY